MSSPSPLLGPSLPSALALSRHGKALWAQREFSVGWNWTKEWVWLLELGVPQGGHLGSQICANEWTVMREWLSFGKEGSGFSWLNGRLYVATGLGA